ncbi:Low complexity protein [Trypanosoma rangeli]|uniref:Low complexity protein n=1 Tax=Trypanosoma rangeli TaxID=5698 RepID=A0A3R7NBC1_TRYRA|nr:Low complexity protein [Trypanosoma rangeli]RNF03684.1 Low complexity protein [Trypanosoma rangeli]|eukprot:RNF03684.1 Low complexity protein [Trypanosoma rangeli]
MSGVDYSKWDKFCDSDESDGEDEVKGGRPCVTRLQYPSRVTVGPNGVHMETPPPLATASPFVDGSVAAVAHNTATAVTAITNPASGGELSLQQSAPKEVKDDDEAEEDAMMYYNLTRNGGREGQSHLWSQTRDTASVSFILPSMSTKAKDIVNFRLCSEEQPDGSSVCVLTFSTRGVEAERRYVFRYPVKLDSDVVEGCWQLHSLPSRSLRLMVVQLVKEPVAVGMSLWWNRCFVTDQTTVDTRTLADRSSTEALRGEQFQRVWQEAHEKFKKRIKERHDCLPVIEEE